MKSTANLDSVDKRIFLLYNEQVYYPFITKIREKDHYRLGQGQAVPEKRNHRRARARTGRTGRAQSRWPDGPVPSSASSLEKAGDRRC